MQALCAPFCARELFVVDFFNLEHLVTNYEKKIIIMTESLNIVTHCCIAKIRMKIYDV
jgi:hypothetical protein